ncbi:hypothetical protein WMY93_031078 [Mugilogobius chulae]|uniref:Uncharacterized protein n=1 Tax=Mugilogobius chulae TaxID=88201 RepID=A0AAW0MHD3_9GOBI
MEHLEWAGHGTPRVGGAWNTWSGRGMEHLDDSDEWAGQNKERRSKSNLFLLLTLLLCGAPGVSWWCCSLSPATAWFPVQFSVQFFQILAVLFVVSFARSPSVSSLTSLPVSCFHFLFPP